MHDGLGGIEKVAVNGASKRGGVKFIIAVVSEKGREATVLRAADERYHSYIANALEDYVNGLGLRLCVLGGGRIMIDDQTRRIFLWGNSEAFGPFDFGMARDLMKDRYPGYDVLDRQP